MHNIFLDDNQKSSSQQDESQSFILSSNFSHGAHAQYFFLTPSNAQGLKITLLLCQSLQKIAKMINFFNHQLQLPRKCSRNVHLCIQSRVMSKNSDTQLFYWLSLKNPRKMGMVKRFYTVGVLDTTGSTVFYEFAKL